MKVVDRSDTKNPGLPIKYVISKDGVHYAFLDWRKVPENNIMAFNTNGEWIWTIDRPLIKHGNFSVCWMKVCINENDQLVAYSSDGNSYYINSNTGAILEKV